MAEHLIFKNYSHSSSENNRTYSKKLSERTSLSVFMRLIIMKKKIKMKNISHRYDIDRPRSRMLICIKQHLSNIWSSVHEKLSKL